MGLTGGNYGFLYFTVWVADETINWEPLTVWMADNTINWEPRSHIGFEGENHGFFLFYSLGGRQDYKLGAVDSLGGRQDYKLGAAFACVFERENYVFSFYSLGGRQDYKLGAVDNLGGRQDYKLGAAFASWV